MNMSCSIKKLFPKVFLTAMRHWSLLCIPTRGALRHVGTRYSRVVSRITFREWNVERVLSPSVHCIFYHIWKEPFMHFYFIIFIIFVFILFYLQHALIFLAYYPWNDPERLIITDLHVVTRAAIDKSCRLRRCLGGTEQRLKITERNPRQ